MWILGVNRSHDGGICLLKDNEIVLSIQEERLTHVKWDRECCYALDQVAKITKHIDMCVYTHLYNHCNDFGPYFKYIKKIGIFVHRYVEAIDYHHALHAACAYYNSPFSGQNTAALIIDGAGSDYEYGKENESIFSIPGDITNISCLKQGIVGYPGIQVEQGNEYTDTQKSIGAGYVYSGVTEFMGWDGLECGKTMGLSSYGKPNNRIKQMLFEYGGSSERFYLADYNEHKLVKALLKPYDYIDYYKDTDDRFKRFADLAYKLQKEFEDYVYHRIMMTHQLTGYSNIVYSGGCALNCVANYRVLKRLPEHINLYVEPISSDAGVAMGAAYTTYAKETPSCFDRKPIKPISTIYLGTEIFYDYCLKKNEKELCDVGPSDVAKLIADGNIVAICQGRSENGPRALGNRSILFDPRNPDGKDIVNRVKKREFFRPFAGSVLLEHAKDWFDLDRLDETPFMMYAVDVLQPEKIPCITHVDNTCRIQTVTKKQNENYYNLIEEFYKLTDVPILFNTSFNLAGDTIVETIEDALKTMRESEMEYLYLPEINKLLLFPNETN